MAMLISREYDMKFLHLPLDLRKFPLLLLLNSVPQEGLDVTPNLEIDKSRDPLTARINKNKRPFMGGISFGILSSSVTN